MFQRLSVLIHKLKNTHNIKIVKLPLSKQYWAIFLKNIQNFRIINIIVDITSSNIDIFMKKV